MVETKTIVFYLLFVVFFNFFAGAFSLQNEDSEFDINKGLLTNEIKNKILDSEIGKNKLIGSTVAILSLPFLILESLIFILYLIGLGFAVLPPILEILILSPIGIIIVFDYVIPAIRGN